MSRPMPPPQRRTLVEQYTGRRQALARAAHAHIKFYEDHEGFDIDWSQHTLAMTERYVQKPVEPYETPPACMCEEDFLRDVLWAFISNTPIPTPPQI